MSVSICAGAERLPRTSIRTSTKLKVTFKRFIGTHPRYHRFAAGALLADVFNFDNAALEFRVKVLIRVVNLNLNNQVSFCIC